MRRRAPWLVLVLVVSAAAVFAGWRWWTASPPWDAMEHARDSFPLPDDYYVADSRRRGSVCRLAVGCDDPMVSNSFAPRGDPTMTCARLGELMDAWAKVGFEAQRPLDRSQATCTQWGSLQDFDVQVTLTRDEFFIHVYDFPDEDFGS